MNMKFDFVSIIERRGKDASAVDGLGKRPGFTPEPPKEGFDAIPMWVADMNFATSPAVTNAIIDRVKHPLFGYFAPRDSYYESIINWQTKRNGYRGLKREYIGYENGVHGCVTSAVETLSAPGDKILIHAPVYVGFSMDVEGLGRASIYSPLKLDENGIWRMDYEDMDAKLKAHNIHLAIFCSPHNPAGRVWERWELEKAMEVYAANECYVISDEIWADVTYTGHQHIPTLMVNDWAKEHTVAIYAPSKTFNLAGLIGSYHVIYNKYLRDRVGSCGYATHYNEMNVLSMHALLGAYSEAGAEWTNELLQVLEGNCKYAYEHIRDHYDGVTAAMPQGTYMIFLDCTEWCGKHGKSLDELVKAGWDVGVGWQDGRRFQGPCHIRMNLASPFSRVQEAFDRLDKHVFQV
jgi:cystathionine beta-lyase